MSALLRDIRYSIRTLLRTPGFTAVVVLALALGIGANTAIYSLVNAVLVRPLPYEHPERLVDIAERDKESDFVPVDYLDYLEWRAQNTVFEEMAFQATFSQTLTGVGPAENVPVGFVSSEFLHTLGVQPILGRGLTASDDQRSSMPVAVLTHAFWQNRFGGDRSVLGRTLRIAQRDFNVIGVLPASFRFHRPGQVYVALGPFLTQWGMDRRGNHNNSFVVARLKPGVSHERAQAQMNTIMRRLGAQFPGLLSGFGASIRPLREAVAGSVRRQVLILLGAVAFVLLIACVNVANLMLARSAVRRHEIVVRTAIGAGRWQIARQLLVECLVVAIAAAWVGLIFAQATFGLLAKLLPWGFEPGDVSIDAVVLAFTLAVACLTAGLFGIVPALQSSAFSLTEALKEDSRSGRSGANSRYLRRALVVAQVAISMVLLTGAGLLARSLWRLMQVNPGFETGHVLTMEINWPHWETAGPAGAVDFHKRLAGRVRALPGVRAAGAIWPMPLDPGGAAIPFYRADKPMPNRGQFPVVPYHRVTPDVFPAMGIPLVRGRLFNAADGQPPRGRTREELEAAWRSSTIAAVISESMARRFFPGEDPVGRRIRFGPPEFKGPWVQVLGVVADIRGAGLDQPPEAELYLSAYQDPNDMTLMVRSAGDPSRLAGAIRSIVTELDPNVAVANVRTMDQVIADRVSWRRLNMILIGSFAALALALAAVGLYGVMSYTVARRRREIGIRMALGARAADVLSAVVKEAALLAAAGIGLGAVGGLALTRMLASMLFGLEATDPGTFVAAAFTLFAVAVAASWIPAHRASGVDPTEALRCD
ncbi:MAG: ABC transporter permease [Acidobacteriota bacterium]